jgi:hypothetical protein
MKITCGEGSCTAGDAPAACNGCCPGGESLFLHLTPLPSPSAQPLTAASPCLLPFLTPPPLLLAKWWSSAAVAPPLPLSGEANGTECCALDGVVRWNNTWPRGADLSADASRLYSEKSQGSQLIQLSIT